MHIFLIFFNLMFFISGIITPHIFFNLINFMLIGFFVYSLFAKMTISRGLMLLTLSLIIFFGHFALSFSQINSISTHLGVALNLYLAIACGLMVRGSFRINRFTQGVANTVLIALIVINIATEVLFSFTPNSPFYTHRSFGFIHLVVAFLLTFPQKITLKEYILIAGIIVYSLLSEGSTGTVLSIFLLLSCIFMFGKSALNTVFKTFGLACFVAIFFIGISLSDIDPDSFSGRISSNITSLFSSYDQPYNVSSKSILERTEMLRVGGELIGENPILGLGFDNSRYFWDSNLYYGYGLEEGGKHLHNTYIEFFVSIGVPLSLVILYLCIDIYRKKSRKVPADYGRIIFIFATTLSLYMLTNTIYKDPGLVFFMTVFLFSHNYFYKDIK